MLLPGSLINSVSSYDQQDVSDIALFVCQAVSSIMSHPMTCWTVCEGHWFITLPGSLINDLIPWPTGCGWHCSGFMSLPGSLINHVSPWPTWVCEWCWFIAFNTRQSDQSCLVPWPTGCKWHRQFHQSCLSLIPLPAGSEWHCFIRLPGSLINHISSTANRVWVILLYLFARLSHELACLIPWPTASEWHCFICLCSLINHVTHSMWVTLLYFFARQSH